MNREPFKKADRVRLRVKLLIEHYSSPVKSASVRLPLICIVCGAKRNSLDETLIVYVWPVATLSNEKKPNELVVAILLKPRESVIDTVELRRPRPSDVSALPFTVASVSVAPDTTNGKSCLTSGAVSGRPRQLHLSRFRLLWLASERCHSPLRVNRQ